MTLAAVVQEGSHASVAALRDTADVVDLARLMPPGDQAQIGADVSGSADARGSSIAEIRVLLRDKI